MKLENEHVLGAQTSPRKSYNPFESDDEDTNGYTKSNINVFDIKSFETTSDSLTFHWDTSNLSWEEAILGHSEILSNSISADASNEEVLCRKDTELFTDKTVNECELPDLGFSYKDNEFQSVKDIVIDEGVPTVDKVSIKSQDNHDSPKLYTARVLNNNVHDDMSFMEGLKSKADNGVEKDPSARENQIEDSVKASGLVHDILERPYSANQCVTDDLLKVDEFKNGLCKKEEESNVGWQSTGVLVESCGVVNGKRDPQLCENDEVTCRIVDKTKNEVSKEEHSEKNVPLANEGEYPAKPLIMHEVVDSKKLDEVNHAKSLLEKSNEVHHTEMFLAKPSMGHEVEATKESNEADIFPEKPSVMCEVEATMVSDEVHQADIFPEKPSMLQEVETTTESNGLHHAEMFPTKLPMEHKVEATTESYEVHNAELISAKPSTVHEVEAAAESNEVPHAQISPAKPLSLNEVLTNRDEGRSEETAGSGVTNSIPYNSKVDSGSIILDFNAAATSSDADKEESSQKNEATVEKPPEAQSMSRDDGGPLPGYNSILDSEADNRVHGETSFSAAMPPPASITYTGPIAYSGNISHRSESSAGSTRSFAFPVLQAEWNSSPVRMAKADQGYFRKQKGWVHSLVCCKF